MIEATHSAGKMPRRRAHRGFTLIELLVVIAIIAILAAILFPVFARARENARRASCMSNLKQIGLGVMQYVQDYDEKYPGPMYASKYFTGPATWELATKGDGTPGGTYTTLGPNEEPRNHYKTWADSIFPYVKSVQVFKCPSAHVDPDALSYSYSGGIGGTYLSDYANDGSGRDVVQGIASAQIRRPSEIVMFLDANHTSWGPRIWPQIVSISQGWLDGTFPGVGDYVSARVMVHLDGANVCYADGHVKWHGKMQPIFKGTGNRDGWDNRNWNPVMD
jgi:prepilin-type N-terminal cleavage/methylation domain-containing protein/prepilin-type processing-associated H-X9-DG protein